jgi:hypothetical protein
MIGRKVTPDPGPVGAAGLPRLGDDGVDLVPRVRQRLTPQAEDVGPRAAHPVRLGRRTADRDRDRAVRRAYEAQEVVELVELPLVAERLGAGPDPAHDVEVLRGAGVPLVLGQIVALQAG